MVLECEVGVSERGFFGGDVDGSILGFLSGGESTGERERGEREREGEGEGEGEGARERRTISVH